MTPSSAEYEIGPPRFTGLYQSLAINVAAPLLVLQVLLRMGTSPFTALACAAIFPFAESVVTLARSRRFDPLAVLSLIAIVVGLLTTQLSGNPAFALAKDSLFTAVFGLVFLGSLATARPMIFRLGKQYSTGGEPRAMAAWDARWSERPGFRRSIRIITIVWGGGLLLEAALRVIAAFTLPIATASLVSVALQVVVIVGLVVWTGAYVRAIRRRVAAAGSRA